MISDYVIIYLAIVGISIISYWIFFILKNKIDKYYMRTHIIAELITAILLIISSISGRFEIILIAIGMLIYASINIIGKYVDERDRKMIVIIILNVVLLIILTNYLLVEVN
ncbi:MAG: hypothetical protein CMO19_03530 [Thaumarchaeota archaeon]|nr:hypothetical protein [Nitrososphaerota archaeon]|tara:strand:+ start:692 stop:1024 length:333 start_codon:yes stop_codon:yes gene_type:complete